MDVEDRLQVVLGFVTVVLFAAVMGYVVRQLFLPATSDKQYLIIFREPISGLEKNSKVMMSGIAVGRVDQIELQPATEQRSFEARVRLTIEPRWADKVVVYQDGKARIRAIGNPRVAGIDKLQPGDVITGVAMAASGAVEAEQWETPAAYLVQHALRRIQRAALDEPSLAYTVTVDRDGATRAVALDSTLGDPELTFSNVGTRAVLITSLVTGLQTIELTGGSTLLRPLPGLPEVAREAGAGSVDEYLAKHPDLGATPAVIPAQATGFNKLLDYIGQKVPRLTQQIDRILLGASESVERVNRILVNVERITHAEGSLEKALAEAAVALEKAGSLVDKSASYFGPDRPVDRLLTQGNQLLTRANAHLAQGSDLDKALADLRQTLANTRDWTAADGHLTKQLDRLQASLDRSLAQANSAMASAESLIKDAHQQALGDQRLEKLMTQLTYVVRKELVKTLADVSSTMQAFRQTMIQMQSNPDSLFLGRRRSGFNK